MTMTTTMSDTAGSPREGDAAPRALLVRADLETLAPRAARRIGDGLAAAARGRGRASVALSGGSTPVPIFERLADQAGRVVPWDRVVVCFGDERAVPPDDEASNYGMARRTLRDHVPLDPAHVHRMRGELAAPAAAEEYERTLRAAFPEAAADPALPLLDVALQGVGEDGHTASLFPGSAALAVRDRWVTASEAPRGMPVHDRITLTLPALARSRAVFVVVSGAEKADVVRRILVDGEALPAALARGRDRTVWMLDRAAAAEL